MLVSAAATQLRKQYRNLLNICQPLCSGIVSELFFAPKFLETFNITTDNSATVKGNIVAILQAGCAVGSLTSNILAGKLIHHFQKEMKGFLIDVHVSLANNIDWIGRNKAIMVSAWVFMIGGIIQAACNTFAPLLVGRFITGCKFSKYPAYCKPPNENILI